ncbi:transcriptional regulator [Microbacterium sp. H1-D42]|uniref:transcriptional regulator n=1 Tax=Microbacterium sp. H1-D42 TaxID=2925844 RepID=UPI001F531116|nr:transcriptional regulator [Microbacterium sp. H1-D42]UNK70222.1 transcriptional regulator [Microbacterium sp. H1-D42]
MAHPRHDLDPALMTPVRLSLLAALAEDQELDFATLRDLIEADDSVVSKGIAHLENLGYVKVTKGYAGARPRTWVTSTVKGRRALERHMNALRAIIGAVDTADYTHTHARRPD